MEIEEPSIVSSGGGRDGGEESGSDMEEEKKGKNSNEIGVGVDSTNDTNTDSEPVHSKLDKEIFNENKALTSSQIKKVWSKFCPEWAYQEYELSELKSEGMAPYAIVFTGNKKDETNDGNDHHWLALVNNSIFDSYGMGKGEKKTQYKLPANIKTFKKPQFQEYNSDICGEYCLLFILNAVEHEDKENLDNHDLLVSFQENYDVSPTDRRHNDEAILEAYKKIVSS